MLGAIFTGLSGMNAYSKGLDVISNNVANLNTPGFKVSDAVFRELVYQSLSGGGSRDSMSRPAGTGVQLHSVSMTFKQGELRGTGNTLDAAIDGLGFFVLDQNGEYRYTRAGQFEFNNDGDLVEKNSGAKVVISTAEQAATHFNLNTARVFDPRATQLVTLTGTLARTGTASTFQTPVITVYDPAGTAVTLRARFVRTANDPSSWSVDITDKDNKVLVSSTVRFAEDGTPAADSNRITVSLPYIGGENFTVTLDLGAPGTHTGVLSQAASTASDVRLLKQDGVPIGSLTKTEFDETGQLKLTYSNGETRNVGTLVIAQYDAPEQLQALGNGMFAAAVRSQQPIFGKGLSKGLGRIVGGQIEMSNVDLTQQFTDLIIMQRGYQASSQISSVANELLQTLLAMDGRR